MRKINRFDDLPNKIKYLVGGGIKLKNVDECRRKFSQMNVYECKNKAELYEIMKREELEPATLIDKDPMQGRCFFVAIGMPHRKTVKDLILFNDVEVYDTVVYFTQLTPAEISEALADERRARKHFKEKAEETKLKNELKSRTKLTNK